MPHATALSQPHTHNSSTDWQIVPLPYLYNGTIPGSANGGLTIDENGTYLVSGHLALTLTTGVGTWRNIGLLLGGSFFGPARRDMGRGDVDTRQVGSFQVVMQLAAGTVVNLITRSNAAQGSVQIESFNAGLTLIKMPL